MKMIFHSIDIFCHIIDNFGDIGVVYRFAREFLIKNPSTTIRVFLDDLDTFSKINFKIDKSIYIQTIDSITYIDWKSLTPEFIDKYGISEVIIEAFGCEIPDFFMKKAYYQSKILINLEYLSAEEWVEGYHLKESLLPEGSLKKYFYMPGFTEKTGGIILNSNAVTNSIKSKADRLLIINNLLSSFGTNPISNIDAIIGSIFTYLRNFKTLVESAVNIDENFIFLIFGNKSRDGMMQTLKDMNYKTDNVDRIIYKNIHIIFMPFISQQQYDILLYCTDFNIVRGEDSLVRAILAEKPFLWNAYLQDKKYQKVKVDAFCRMIQKYFDSAIDFTYYHELMLKFNDIEKEDADILPEERYEYFFNNLHKFEHSTRKMSYFLSNSCNLIDKIDTFIKRV